MRKLFAGPVLALVSVALLSACADDSTTEPSAVDCEQLASDNAQAHGDRIFVEAGGAQYVVDGVRSLPDDRVIVATSVDQPDLVGYPQVQFLSSCKDGELVLLGGYVPIDGAFELLFTTNEAGDASDIPYVAP